MREQDRVVLIESVCLVRRIHPGEEKEYAEAANGLDRRATPERARSEFSEPRNET